MKKHQIFNLIGIVSFIIAIVLTYFLIWTGKQEPINLIQETIFGISSVSMYCLAVTMLIISYRIKERL